tara:strand:+ start:44 stop:160 length:117 start_codon:yes stop_codon:yes gene_type:complete
MNPEKSIDRGFLLNVVDVTGLSLPRFPVFQKTTWMYSV